MITKQSKNSLRKLNTPKEIADVTGMHYSNVDKVYFNPNKPHKHNMGRALDIGVFVIRNNISLEDFLFAMDFIKSHKQYIRSKI